MVDPFFNGGGEIVSGGSVGVVRRISMVQLQKEKAISAYRRNIALPDVHIADRDEEYVPKVVGEDGEELTIERRRQLMAGKKPMFDSKGEETQEVYTDKFDEDIEAEPLGKTAVENRPGIRVVRPRELEIKLDIDETTVASSEGDTVIHEGQADDDR